MSDSRLEKFIYAICSMDVSDLPVPLSRIEKLWNCLITGETPDFEPLSRNEKYLMAMLDRYDISNLPAPMSRGEKLLYKIAVGETDLSDVPGCLSRYEELLKYLIENGEISEDDFEYVLHTLNQSLSTLYTTAEKPVKSAILKGNTKYRDIDTGDILDTFDETKNLELVSVKLPVLKTIGENIIGECINPTEKIKQYKAYLKPNTTYTLSYKNTDGSSTGSGKVYLKNGDIEIANYGYKHQTNFTTPSTTNSETILCINSRGGVDISVLLIEGEVSFSDLNLEIILKKPYKSNILTVNEDVTLRSNGDVYDELNLLTGRLTQRIDENNEVLAQEVVKTVDLTVVDQDNQPTELGTFENITHVSLEAENLIPILEMKVATMSYFSFISKIQRRDKLC